MTSLIQVSVSEHLYNDDDMPMRICNIDKFERNNPSLRINVFKYNDDVGLMNGDDDNEVFKNPFVDVLYRTKNVNGQHPHQSAFARRGWTFPLRCGYETQSTTQYESFNQPFDVNGARVAY